MCTITEELAAMKTCVEALRPLPEAARTRVMDYVAAVFGRPSSPPPSKLREALSSQSFKGQRTAQDRYLWIARFLSQQLPHPLDLLEVASDVVKGRSRTYFADNPKTIEGSGKGSKAVRLDATLPLWADVNNSTDAKRRITRAIMDRLGYSQDDIEAAVAAI